MTMDTDTTGSLRDRFAGIVLAQQSDKLHPRWATKDHLKQMSVYCYAIADAMIAARETPTEAKTSKPKVLTVNSNVRVKLTDHGRSVHAKEHADFWSNMSVMYGVDRPYTPPKEDAHGWSTSPLWHLMQVFGPQMSPGSTPCFEADIEVVE